jgi:hypothetical protein
VAAAIWLPSHLLVMLLGHHLLMMLRVHLLLMVLHLLLIHRMLSATSVSVLGSVGGVQLGLISLSVVLVPVEIFSVVRVPLIPVLIFGSDLVAVFSRFACSCALAVMFSHVPGIVFSVSGSRCGSDSFRTFARVVGLIK